MPAQQQVQNKDDFFLDPDLWPFQDREPLLLPEDHCGLLWGEVGSSTVHCLFSRALGNSEIVLECCVAGAVPQHSPLVSKKFGKDLFSWILERCSSTSGTTYSAGFGKGEVGSVSKNFTMS